MKVTVSHADLQEALSAVLPAVSVKNSTPVLSGVYLSASNSGLTLRATNNELEITAAIPANVEEAGVTVTAGKYFGAIVSKLGGEIVTLKEDGTRLTVRSEAASFNLLTMNADDFPTPIATDDGESFRINGDALKGLIARTAFACGLDFSRPFLTGVNFVVGGQKIRAEGTNAVRIGIADETTYDSANANVIVPAAALNAIVPRLGRQIVTVTPSEKVIRFDVDNVRVVSRLIDGTYPDVEKVVPTEVVTRAVVERDELKEALERMRVISLATEYKGVALKFSGEGLEIRTRAQEIGDAVEHVDADVSGEEIELAFSNEYLLDGLRHLGNKVAFGLAGQFKPALLTAEGDDSYKYVVTPLRAL